jgi:hypothetical protein
MKKFLGVLLAIILMAGSAYAAGSCAVGSYDTGFSPAPGMVDVKTLQIVCTGDSSTGSYPSTSVNMAPVSGWFLWTVKAVPGGTAPTNNYVLKLNDSTGFDVLGGAGGAMSNASTGCKIMPRVDTITYKQDLVPVIDNYSLVITGNSVASAVVTFTLVFIK